MLIFFLRIRFRVSGSNLLGFRSDLSVPNRCAYTTTYSLCRVLYVVLKCFVVEKFNYYSSECFPWVLTKIFLKEGFIWMFRITYVCYSVFFPCNWLASMNFKIVFVIWIRKSALRIPHCISRLQTKISKRSHLTRTPYINLYSLYSSHTFPHFICLFCIFFAFGVGSFCLYYANETGNRRFSSACLYFQRIEWENQRVHHSGSGGIRFT